MKEKKKVILICIVIFFAFFAWLIISLKNDRINTVGLLSNEKDNKNVNLNLISNSKNKGGNKELNSDNVSVSDIDIDMLDYSNVTGKVCIDAGHGGIVPITAPDEQEIEKKDTLELSKLVKEHIERLSKVNVIMTREDDVSVELDDRCKIANDNHVDYFVSIHRNLSDNSEVKGVEIWTSYKKVESTKKLVNNVYNALLDSHISSGRGIKEGSASTRTYDYKVNAETTMPSILIEMGFMSNEEDNMLLEKYKDEYAEKIAKAILKTLLEEKNEF